MKETPPSLFPPPSENALESAAKIQQFLANEREELEAALQYCREPEEGADDWWDDEDW